MKAQTEARTPHDQLALANYALAACQFIADDTNVSFQFPPECGESENAVRATCEIGRARTIEDAILKSQQIK